MSREPKIKVIQWERTTQLTQEEAEARLHHEGYELFCWHDVSKSNYPKHKHDYDECLWILKGEFHLNINDQTYILKRGDRIYLPSQTLHSSHVPDRNGVTYLVGRKTPSHR
jgi:mannose-6-phosphate isomerase-like protein (cupin superfamily)